MKKLSKILRIVGIAVLISPFVIAWMPFLKDVLLAGVSPAYQNVVFGSFQQLTVTLLTTLAVAMVVTIVLGYFSILSMGFGRTSRNILDGIESIPAILVALFCYAPVSSFLASSSQSYSSVVSLMVFVFAATITTLPESVRGVALPLSELYHRKYSVSFRAYGFTKGRILTILMNSRTMRDVFRRTSASILLRTLVLDCSFGFIIQLGMGSYGTPAHSSPGALIAASRDVMFNANLTAGRTPLMFWLPVILLVSVSLAFLLLLGNDKEAE